MAVAGRRTPKKLTTRAAQQRQLVGLAILANSVSQDFEQVGKHLQTIREVLAEQSVRIDALEAKVTTLLPEGLTTLSEQR